MSLIVLYFIVSISKSAYGGNIDFGRRLTENEDKSDSGNRAIDDSDYEYIPGFVDSNPGIDELNSVRKRDEDTGRDYKNITDNLSRDEIGNNANEDRPADYEDISEDNESNTDANTVGESDSGRPTEDNYNYEDTTEDNTAVDENNIINIKKPMDDEAIFENYESNPGTDKLNNVGWRDEDIGNDYEDITDDKNFEETSDDETGADGSNKDQNAYFGDNFEESVNDETGVNSINTGKDDELTEIDDDNNKSDEAVTGTDKYDSEFSDDNAAKFPITNEYSNEDFIEFEEVNFTDVNYYNENDQNNLLDYMYYVEDDGDHAKGDKDNNTASIEDDEWFDVNYGDSGITDDNNKTKYFSDDYKELNISNLFENIQDDEAGGHLNSFCSKQFMM